METPYFKEARKPRSIYMTVMKHWMCNGGYDRLHLTYCEEKARHHLVTHGNKSFYEMY